MHYLTILADLRKYFLYILLFVSMSFIVFFPTIFSTPLWDDWAFIFHNYVMNSTTSPFVYLFGNEIRAWPIFHTVLWMMLKTFKNHYVYYHVASITLHGLNGFLTWYLLRKFNFKNSLWLALLFIVHPLQLFTVAWIIQVKTLLSIFFLLLSVIKLERFYSSSNFLSYLLAILFFALSVFSKSTTALFTVFLLCLPVFIKSKFSLTRLLVFYLPFVFLSYFSVVQTAWQPHYKSLLPTFSIIFITGYLLYKLKIEIKKIFLILIPILLMCFLFIETVLHIPYEGFLAIVFLVLLLVVFVALRFQLRLRFFILIILPLQLIPYIMLPDPSFKEFILNWYYSSFLPELSIFTIVIFLGFRFKHFLKKYILVILPTLTLVYLVTLVSNFHFYQKMVIITSQTEKVILTLHNLVRYLVFIVFPINNILFPTDTHLSLTSLEFIYIFLGLYLIFLLWNYLTTNNHRYSYLGLLFFVITLLPFCGFFFIPIFTYTNFIPYWLGIPFLGLLPLFSHVLKSTRHLALVVIIFAAIAHAQSYKFIKTEEVFLESINLSPQKNILRASLIEHYVFTHQCEKAKMEYQRLGDEGLAIEFSIENKIHNCKKDNNLK